MINFPTSLDTLSNPTSTDLLENANPALDHDVQHSDANDAIEALEAKVGINGSAVTTSHDYKLSAVTGSAKALTSGTSTQSVTGLTLISPTLTLTGDATGDMYYRNSGGVLTRLPAGTDGQIISYSGGVPTTIANPAAADASTTVKGVVEEATLAETLARTATGGTSARLFVNPSTLTTVQTYDYAASSVGTDAYAITVTPAPIAYVAGQVFKFKADVANTGACTLNVNSLGAISIKKPDGNDTSTGDIIADQIIEVIYNGTNFQLISTLPSYTSSLNVPSSSPENRPFLTRELIIPPTSILGATITGTVTGGNVRTFLNSGATVSCSAIYELTSSSKTVILDFYAVINQNSTTFIGGVGLFGLDRFSTTTPARIDIVNNATDGFRFTTCDGSATTSTVITGVTAGNMNKYTIVKNGTSSVLLYVNGELKATHTTNLPTTTTLTLSIAAITTSLTIIRPVISIEL
jgi:hypothetical protein